MIKEMTAILGILIMVVSMGTVAATSGGHDTWTCPWDNKQFKSSESLKNHIQSCHCEVKVIIIENVPVPGPKGDKGDKGCTGATGPQGPQGEQGIQGLQGLPGLNGLNGLDGLPGLNGIDGLNGSNGIDGINGTDGINGLNGTNGINGVTTKIIEPISKTIEQQTVPLQHTGIPLSWLGFAIVLIVAGLGYTWYLRNE